MKIALISCGGLLPVMVHEHLQMHNHNVTVIGFSEVTSHLPCDYTVSLGQVGKIFSYLHKHHIQNILLAGHIKRPNLWRLRFDLSGLKLAFKIIPFLKKGDDALLRFVCDYLESKQLKLLSVADLCPQLLMPLGVITHNAPTAETLASLDFGKNILNKMAEFDIGQSIAVAGQVVIAIETIGGTDSMINHVASLDKNRMNGMPKPLFIKMRKKNQSNFVDLPTIGVETIDNLHKAGFKTAAFEAGGCLILDIKAVIHRAETLGLSIIGFAND